MTEADATAVIYLKSTIFITRVKFLNRAKTATKRSPA